MSTKETHLHPAKTTHFWWFLSGIILTPIFGLGLILIYIKYREINSITYKITDREIEVYTPEFNEKTDLKNISDATVKQRWIDKQFSIGTIFLNTQSKKTELRGIKNPKKIADIILQAAEAERLRIREREQTKPVREESKPAGTIDRLEYLTGLWQQGLITNDEFEAERKNLGL